MTRWIILYLDRGAMKQVCAPGSFSGTYSEALSFGRHTHPEGHDGLLRIGRYPARTVGSIIRATPKGE